MLRKLVLVVFLFVVVLATATNATSGIVVGANSFAINTSPTSLVVGVVVNILFIVCAIRLKGCAVREEGRVGLFRRVAALLLDVSFFIFAILPFVTFVFSGVMYLATGEFAWQIIRSQASAFELGVANGVIYLSIALFFLYYYLALKYGLSTLGQFLAGYKIINHEGGAVSPINIISRILLSLIALAVWPVTLLVEIRKHRGCRLWYERNSIFVAKLIDC